MSRSAASSSKRTRSKPRIWTCDYGSVAPPRRAQDGDYFTFVPAVHSEIGIYGDDRMSGKQFAHANKAKVGEVGAAVRIATRHRRELGQIFRAVEGQSQHSIRNERKHKR